MDGSRRKRPEATRKATTDQLPPKLRRVERLSQIRTREIPAGARLEMLSGVGRVFTYGGDDIRASLLNHAPGMNSAKFYETAGIVQCEVALRLAGITGYPEDRLTSLAMSKGLCAVKMKRTDLGRAVDATRSGQTTLLQQAALLREVGLPASVKERGSTIEDLAGWVKDKTTVIIPVDKSLLGESRSKGQERVMVLRVAVREKDSTIAAFKVMRVSEPRKQEPWSDVQKLREESVRWIDAQKLRETWRQERQGPAVLVDTAIPSKVEQPDLSRLIASDAVPFTLVDHIQQVQHLESLDPAAFKPIFVERLTQLLIDAGQDLNVARQLAAGQAHIFDRLAQSRVPCFRGTLANGREVFIVGDAAAAAIGHERQGNNHQGYISTCGFSASRGVLHQSGIDTTEAALVGHAHEHNLCGNERHTGLNPRLYGWTTVRERRNVIEDFGGKYKDVILYSDRPGMEKWSDTLAWTLVDGNGVLLSIHIAPGWNWPEGFASNLENHIINPTAAMYDLRSIQLLGFFANDGNRERGGTYFPGELIEQATDAASNSTIQTYHIPLPEHPSS